MITNKSTQQELIQEINSVFTQFIDMISMLQNEKINQIPYENSWTAGQLINHVTKSINGVTLTMKMEGQPTPRNGEKITELKNIFLDFSKKMKSPEEILPDNKPYEKQKVISDLQDCFKNLSFYSAYTNLDELIVGMPFGDVTKYELLHFALYHSQRHLRQMKRIYEAVII